MQELSPKEDSGEMGRQDYFINESQHTQSFDGDHSRSARNLGKSQGFHTKYAEICRSGELQELMQCPICLGILRNTRAVMECLHRFCRECIDKAMRLGKNECPTCRTHCASRRSLRDDPHFDALIAAVYPDLEKLEEQEFTLLEENIDKNNQTQRRIAEAFKRQSEALARFKRPKSVAIRAKIATDPRGIGCADERFTDYDYIGTSCLLPDLNRDGAESSTTMTIKVRRPAEKGQAKETTQMHGLNLLSDHANNHEDSGFMQTVPVIVTDHGIKDNDTEATESTEGRNARKRKRGRGSKNGDSFADNIGDLVHIASTEMPKSKSKEAPPTPTGHGQGPQGTGYSNGLVPLEYVNIYDEYLGEENRTAEESRSRHESQSSIHGVTLMYERGRSLRKKAKSQIRALKSGTQVKTAIRRVSRAHARAKSPKKGKLCGRASALLSHLLASARQETEDEYDIHLQVRPLVEHSNGEDLLPCLDKPYLCCPPRMTIQHLCKYLATKFSSAWGRKVELLVSTSSVDSTGPSGLKQPEDMEVKVLRAEYTLNYVLSNFWHRGGDMILQYRGLKPDGSG